MFQNLNLNHLLIHRDGDGDEHLLIRSFAIVRDLMVAIVPEPIRNISPDAVILCLLLINVSVITFSNADAYSMAQTFSIAISESIVDSAIFWCYSLFQLASAIVNYTPSYLALQTITICSQIVIVMGCAAFLMVIHMFEKKIADLEQELKKYKEFNVEIAATNKDN
jgi:hypothetical protein